MIITAGRPGEDRAQCPIQDLPLRYVPEQSGVAVNEVRQDGLPLPVRRAGTRALLIPARRIQGDRIFEILNNCLSRKRITRTPEVPAIFRRRRAFRIPASETARVLSPAS